uniref:Uncharacterized protein n=1 Tax=Hyaloperonospora arabidopsidis (strain Emoy2) TaxID=559515 RepID=M4C5L0_HYAAE
MTLDELCERYAASGLREKSECKTPVTVLIQREMKEMIQDVTGLQMTRWRRKCAFFLIRILPLLHVRGFVWMEASTPR